MTISEIIKIKAELLCYGVRLEDSAKEMCVYKNSYILDGGFVHAAHFLIEGTVINTCITETFCKESPYAIISSNDCFILTKNEMVVCEIEILPLPKWCKEKISDYLIGDYFRPHSPNCISGCPKLKCTYYRTGDQCKFCSLESPSNEASLVLPDSVVVKMINEALEYNPNYEIALSGGTCSFEDHSAKYFSNICKLLTAGRTTKLDISVELAPPDKDEYIEELFESGVTALIMNVEITNEVLRSTICPGKSSIPLTRYFSAFKKAVEVFGKGNVSSVLIAGIQPVADIIALSEKLIHIGVVPTIIPFKPLDSCLMHDMPLAKPEEVIYIAKIVNGFLQKEDLHTCKQGGCTKCGGCSLESTFQLNH
jgi:hypothetical protein